MNSVTYSVPSKYTKGELIVIHAANFVSLSISPDCVFNLALDGPQTLSLAPILGCYLNLGKVASVKYASCRVVVGLLDGRSVNGELGFNGYREVMAAVYGADATTSERKAESETRARLSMKVTDKRGRNAN